MATQLLENFKRYVEQNGLVTYDDRVLLTVSGGVDSMVLLDLFAKSGYNIGIAHCNFQLRGEESDEDEVVVEQRATLYGVEHFNQRFETTAEMERTGESMEMAARRLRYDWFEGLCQDHGYTTIAIAHHADDSIETFFINLFRGTGLRGLTGIKMQRGRVIRPLNFATRKEILEYAIANNIPYREDSSNRSTKYLRNKIRLGLIPRAREINSKFTQLMQSNLGRLHDAQSFISSCIDSIADEVISLNEEGIYRLHTDRINERLPLQFVIYELLNSRFDFKGDIINSLLRSKESGGSGGRFYSRDFVAYLDRGDILITKIEPTDSCEVELCEGATRSYCGNSILHIETIAIDLVDQLNLGNNVALLDANKLRYPLTIRRWREGDSFIPLGMSGHKKVSDLLIDEKVSMPEKERQFILLSEEQIVWVIGRRIDERFKITEESENILKITKEIV